MEKISDLSIVIVNFNTRELTRKCLLSIQKSSPEVIVCDNGSTDGSLEVLRKEFPYVRFIDNKKNLGFAAGNNPGIKLSTGKYVLLLNSDTEVSPLALSSMTRFMDDHPEVGAATCKLILPDGSMDPACHRGFPTPWAAFTYVLKLEMLLPKTKLFGQYHQFYKDLSTVHEVDSISGAFFLVRREVIKQVGLLDEDYFMYGEDIDWAYRIKAAGWKIMFNPKVSVLHKKKQSGRAHGNKKQRRATDIYFHTNNWLFFKKHYAKNHPVLSVFVHLFYTVRLFFLKTLCV